MADTEYDTFPVYFWQCGNTHMTLCKAGEGSYTLTPPNQCDWMYTITRLGNDDRWQVLGTKSDYLEEDAFMYDETFERDADGKWIVI